MSRLVIGQSPEKRKVNMEMRTPLVLSEMRAQTNQQCAVATKGMCCIALAQRSFLVCSSVVFLIELIDRQEQHPHGLTYGTYLQLKTRTLY